MAQSSHAGLQSQIQQKMQQQVAVPLQLPQQVAVPQPEFTCTVLKSRVENFAQVHLTVSPPDVKQRFAGDILVVLDVSASMMQEAVIKGGEAPGLQVLDVVKHTVKAIANSMEEHDRLAIIAYSDFAWVELDLTHMNEVGKQLAERALAELQASGQTNLWNGLEVALDLIQANVRQNTTAAVMLLTDGVPTVDPEGGHVCALQDYRVRKGGSLPATLCTFGFGNDLDSKLLADLATEGGGMYTFIPDSSFVGTAIVNSVANALVSYGHNAYMELQPKLGLCVKKTYGCTENANGGIIVPLGTLQLGQTRDALVDIGDVSGPHSHLLFGKLVYSFAGGTWQVNLTEQEQIVTTDIEENTRLEVQCGRIESIKILQDAVQLGIQGLSRQASELVAKHERALQDFHPHISALKQDLAGQVVEAVSRKDFFDAWGAHYLRSLASAHQMQQCSNFKDPGVQVYGGTLFQQVRDTAEEMFISLAAPQHEQCGGIVMLQSLGFDENTARRSLQAASGNLELAANYCFQGIPTVAPTVAPARRAPATQATPAQAPAVHAPATQEPIISMRDYYNSSGPCFSGSSLVELESGVVVELRNLCRGDYVRTPNGCSAMVKCITITPTPGKADLVTLGKGMFATPWHPVLVNGEWKFPASIGRIETCACDAVYNIVLDTDHILCIGGVWTVSLGHELQGEVVSHPFWGTRKVLDDLMKMTGWSSGKILLRPNSVVRDASGLACSLHE